MNRYTAQPYEEPVNCTKHRGTMKLQMMSGPTVLRTCWQVTGGAAAVLRQVEEGSEPSHQSG